MRKIAIAVLWLFLVGFCGGCATIPKETVALSGEISGMISSAKTAHLNLLDQYEVERRGRIDEYMESTWIPKFIRQMARDGDLWGKTCKIANTRDAAEELQGFVEAAAQRMAAKRKELTDALDYAMLDLRAAVDTHYSLLEQSNQVVTRNLRSVRANDEVLESMLKKNGVDIEKLTPLRDVSAKLDKLMGKGD
jgi:hypothetical protein